MTKLSDILEHYGAPAEGVRLLGVTPTPDHLRYLDLMQGRSTADLLPDAVVEVEGDPVCYALDGRLRSVGQDEIGLLSRTLAYRGDAAYLAILEPGQLCIYDLTLGRKPGRQEARLLTQVSRDLSTARSTFQGLWAANPVLVGQSDRGPTIESRLFDLLSTAIDNIRSHDVTTEDAISLVGRALFARFVLDRQILTNAPSDPLDLFSGPETTAQTCQWLDQTFNGDFLPIQGGFSLARSLQLPAVVFEELSHIMRRRRDRQLLFSWADIDFAHVPVGVLSQVYERQAALHTPDIRKRQSVFYTPRRIAEYMVAEVFSGLRAEAPSSYQDSRVLDPAVGGGIFLVASFRELVAARWRFTGAQPSPKEIREILYTQLVGYDIHEPALRLTALSLYLTALELDPAPAGDDLKFKSLRDSVLFNVHEATDSRFPLGSLGAVPEEHLGSFDVVLGNPPWTAWSGHDGRATHREVVARLRPQAEERLDRPNSGRGLCIPDALPDIAFAWRATAWAREDGWIALAMHGRLLFKNSRQGQLARDSLFRGLTVSGILNGADLRKSKVWPEISAPFCILFARNSVPEPSSGFYYISPYLDPGRSSQGRLNIDHSSARPVLVSQLEKRPSLLKTLFRGSQFDADILERVLDLGFPTLSELWLDLGLMSGQGFIAGDPRRRTRSAAKLKGLPVLRASSRGQSLIRTAELRSMQERKLQWPRDIGIYRAPLLVVRESAGAFPQAQVSYSDLCYSESFHGYSAHGVSVRKGRQLVRVLALLFNSGLFSWYSLMTSSKFGVERDVHQQQDIGSLPVPRLQDLSDSQLRHSTKLFRGLDHGGTAQELEEWVAEIYGLSSWDLEVIRDTLDVSPPTAACRRRAQSPPTQVEVDGFIELLWAALREYFPRALRPVCYGPEGCAQWLIVEVDLVGSPCEGLDLEELLNLASEFSATRFVFARSSGIVVALAREYRYWTPTRARQLAIEIVRGSPAMAPT